MAYSRGEVNLSAAAVEEVEEVEEVVVLDDGMGSPFKFELRTSSGGAGPTGDFEVTTIEVTAFERATSPGVTPEPLDFLLLEGVCSVWSKVKPFVPFNVSVTDKVVSVLCCVLSCIYSIS